EAAGCRIAIDGLVNIGALVGGYRAQGPSGLLGGSEAYAVIVKDPARDGLLLARNGDGPPLYYAQIESGTVVASEPEALLAAGRRRSTRRWAGSPRVRCRRGSPCGGPLPARSAYASAAVRWPRRSSAPP